MSKIYAYLRVSTKLQTTENQRLKIENAGFAINEWIVEHAVSGSVRALERPEFAKLIERVEKGDTIIAVSLDRLGRDTEDVLHTIRRFQEKGVHIRLMDLDGVDLTSSTGKMLTTLLSLVAEMEREKCINRSLAGVERAREEGKVFGRPLKIPYPALKELCQKREEGVTLDKLSAEYGFDRNTICQVVKRWRDELPAYKARWEQQQAQKVEKMI